MPETRDLSDLTTDEKEVIRRRVGLAISTGLSREEVALRLNIEVEDVVRFLKSKTAKAALKLATATAENLVAANNAFSAQEFVDDARANHDIVRTIRDTSFPITREAQDAAVALNIPLNPSLAKTIAMELLGLAGHTKVNKSEHTQKLEISPSDAALLSDALTEAKQNRALQIIDVPKKFIPLDSHD